ncbi:MAG: class I SAM-dependent methyltransferase [Planctomycetota bacterium]|jgi:ubiquinone/menaquinone biosynthesis C-methylase UbiE|nr:class I SAM-dependent methyltransferase [Planctomycetota bacterium]MDP6504440.1 class I SAM-dependent methyltransferase [Planctomycetota bacterium]
MQRQQEHELMHGTEATVYAAADFESVNAAYVESLQAMAGEMAGAALIDLGTGPGDIAIRIALARPDWKVTGLDGSEDMLQLARDAERRASLSSTIAWVCADAKASELPAASFNILISNSILHHVSDPIEFWREVGRLAASDALIFMRDLHRPESEEAARAIIEEHAAEEPEVLRNEFYNSLLASYTCEEVREQIAQAGLDLRVEMSSDRHLDVLGSRR